MSLYHKYRPQQFANVAGQTHIIQTITNQIKREKVGHAYLFSGPRGIGKTTTARLLAKAVNCESLKNDFEPCNSCTSCERINNGQSIDIIEIDAASHTGVDNVRQNIIDNAQFKPTSARFKVFIIDEVHMLSTSAFNALLKTLEEPPAHVIFILATTELHKLPETIISRCQRFVYKKVPFDTIREQLRMVSDKEGVDVEDKVLSRVVGKSEGCMRDALTLLDQLFSSGEKNITEEIADLFLPRGNTQQLFDFLEALVQKNTTKGLELLHSFVEEGMGMKSVALNIVELLRAAMLLSTNKNLQLPSFDLSDEQRSQLISLTQSINAQELLQLLELTMKRSREINLSPIPTIPLEMLIIGWCANSAAVPVSTDKKKEETFQVKQTPAVEKKAEASKPPIEKIESPAPKIDTPKQIPSNGSTTKEDVLKIWNSYLEKIEKQTPSLTMILRSVSVSAVNGNTIVLSVPFTFHKDKLEDTELQKTMQNLMSELLGIKINFEISLVEKQQKEEASGSSIQDLANLLGGQVV